MLTKMMPEAAHAYEIDLASKRALGLLQYVENAAQDLKDTTDVDLQT